MERGGNGRKGVGDGKGRDGSSSIFFSWYVFYRSSKYDFFSCSNNNHFKFQHQLPPFHALPGTFYTHLPPSSLFSISFRNTDKLVAYELFDYVLWIFRTCEREVVLLKVERFRLTFVNNFVSTTSSNAFRSITT